MPNIIRTDTYSTEFSSLVEKDFCKTIIDGSTFDPFNKDNNNEFNRHGVRDNRIPISPTDAELDHPVPTPVVTKAFDYAVSDVILYEKPYNKSHVLCDYYPLGSDLKNMTLGNGSYPVKPSSDTRPVYDVTSKFSEKIGFSWDGAFSSSNEDVNLLKFNNGKTSLKEYWGDCKSSEKLEHTIFGDSEGVKVTPHGDGSYPSFSYSFTPTVNGYYCFSLFLRVDDYKETTTKITGKEEYVEDIGKKEATFLYITKPTFGVTNEKYVTSSNIVVDGNYYKIPNEYGRICCVASLTQNKTYALNFKYRYGNVSNKLITCGYEITKSDCPVEYDPRSCGYTTSSKSVRYYPIALRPSSLTKSSFTVKYNRFITNTSDNKGKFVDQIGNVRFGYDNGKMFHQVGTDSKVELSDTVEFNKLETIVIQYKDTELYIYINGVSLKSDGISGFSHEINGYPYPVTSSSGEKTTEPCYMILGGEFNSSDKSFRCTPGKYSDVMIWGEYINIDKIDDVMMYVGSTNYNYMYYSDKKDTTTGVITVNDNEKEIQNVTLVGSRMFVQKNQ